MSDTQAVNDQSVNKSVWLRSLKEFSNLRVIVFCGMMAAVAMVLRYVGSVSLGPFVRVGFSDLPNVCIDFLFGPAVGAIFGGTLDILKYITKPDGPFFPGFTISAALGGLIFGFAFYKKKITWQRVFIAELIVKVAVNIGLNTLWLVVLYNKALFAILPARVISNAIQLPVDTIIIYFMLKAVERSIKPMFSRDT